MLYKLAQDNKLPDQRIGKRWLFHKDAIGRRVQNYPGGSGSGTKGQ